MRAPKIGDVIEIKTSRGASYALYTHKHPSFGALLRVFSRSYPTRPADFDCLAAGKIQFEVFFPLGAAINRGLVEVVGNISVPVELRQFPIFRDGIADPITKKVQNWWLWDGKTEWPIGNLTSDQRQLPIRQVINDTLLRKYIENGWSAELET